MLATARVLAPLQRLVSFCPATTTIATTSVASPVVSKRDRSSSQGFSKRRALERCPLDAHREFDASTIHGIDGDPASTGTRPTHTKTQSRSVTSAAGAQRYALGLARAMSAAPRGESLREAGRPTVSMPCVTIAWLERRRCITVVSPDPCEPARELRGRGIRSGEYGSTPGSAASRRGDGSRAACILGRWRRAALACSGRRSASFFKRRRVAVEASSTCGGQALAPRSCSWNRRAPLSRGDL